MILIKNMRYISIKNEFTPVQQICLFRIQLGGVIN